MGSIASRYFVFGLGSAFVILPLLFFLIYNAEYKNTAAAYSSAKGGSEVSGISDISNISDEDIIARAEELGMVLSTSPAVDGEMSEDEMLDKISKEAIIGRGMELGIVPATEIVPSAEAEEILRKMGAAAESGEGEVGTETDETEEIGGDGASGEAGASDGNGTSGEADASGSSDPGQQEVIRVDIPQGVSSSTISQILEKAGVVNDAEKLSNYFDEKEMSRKLLEGSYEFREGESFEEILKMIGMNSENSQ